RERFDLHDLRDLVPFHLVVAFNDDLFNGWFLFHQDREDLALRGIADIQLHVGEVAHLIDGLQILPEAGGIGYLPLPGLHHSQDGVFFDAAVALDIEVGDPHLAKDFEAQFLSHLTAEAGEGLESGSLELQSGRGCPAAQIQELAFQGEGLAYLHQGAVNDHVGPSLRPISWTRASFRGSFRVASSRFKSSWGTVEKPSVLRRSWISCYTLSPRTSKGSRLATAKGKTATFFRTTSCSCARAGGVRAKAASKTEIMSLCDTLFSL